MRVILSYLLCRVARSFRGGDPIHGSSNRMLYLDNLGEAVNCKMKHQNQRQYEGNAGPDKTSFRTGGDTPVGVLQ